MTKTSIANAFPMAWSPLDVPNLCSAELTAKYSGSLSALKKWSGQQMPLDDDIYGDVDIDAALAARDAEKKGVGAGSSAKPLEPAPAQLRGGTPAAFAGAYELFGVLAHVGSEPDSGKFVSFVKMPKPWSSWICFDDAGSAMRVSEYEVRMLKGVGSTAAPLKGTSAAVAHLLFYRAYDEDDVAGNFAPPAVNYQSSSRFNFQAGASSDSFGGSRPNFGCGRGGGG